MDQLRRIGDAYCFWISTYQDSHDLPYYNELKNGTLKPSGIYHPVASLPDGELVTFESKKGGLTLVKCDCLTGKNTYPTEGDEGADAYILLGDYLYRYYSGEGWQKTNISNGWDSLQWEIFQMPD